MLRRASLLLGGLALFVAGCKVAMGGSAVLLLLILIAASLLLLLLAFNRNRTSTNDVFVKTVFDAVAAKYDVMNDIMSFGIHRTWKSKLVKKYVRPRAGGKYLDIAAGSGDIAFLILRGIPTTKSDGRGALPDVTVLDINEQMLAVAKKRASEAGIPSPTVIDFVPGNCEALPFPPETFDSITIGFGIRNFEDRPKALRETFRVLKRGATLNILEFTPRVSFRLLAMGYYVWLRLVIPLIGWMIVGDSGPYRYLGDSIAAFPTQDAFASMMQNAGFTGARYENLLFGVAAIHTATKP